MSIEVIGGEPKTIDLEEGKYTGKIRFVEAVERGGFKYLDMYVNLSGKDVELKTGFPLPKPGDGLNPESLLGRAVESFNASKIVKGENYKMEGIFEGKSCSFLVKKKGKYFEIDRETFNLVTEIKERA